MRKNALGAPFRITISSRFQLKPGLRKKHALVRSRAVEIQARLALHAEIADPVV